MYMDRRTPLPPYLPLPRFLLPLSLSVNAKLLYGLLLSRTQLSQKNGWVDGQGRVYVIYTVAHMAEDMRRSPRTIEKVLKELEKAGLLERVRQGWQMANWLYILLPEKCFEGTETTHHDEKKAASCMMPKAALSSVQENSPCRVQNVQGNKNEKNQQKKSQQEGERSLGQGSYQNVRLNAKQLESLRHEFPGQWSTYVEKLSTYMQQSGKHYADHEAVIRKWIAEDHPAAEDVYQNFYEEGDYL